MKKLLLTAFILLASANIAMAQEVSATDLSHYELFEEGETFKTLDHLQAMEEAYEALLIEGNCGAAIPAIVEFYEAANRLSNLIRRGIDPFYDASRDERSGVDVSGLVAAEKTSNDLIEQRNRAWVEEAKCLLSEGKKQAGIIRLYRALDYISTRERELWEEARRLLWAEVGYNAEN
ncbi:MAG: hypothetical protein GDA49_02425 [Rhodospirillales bacterium]|nr:hypothetical protein [Rhodospirillales bacterium]